MSTSTDGHAVPAAGGRLAIEVRAVTRDYTRAGGERFHALDGIDLAVWQGELFGLLGPNGAGKTTLIRILTTLLLPTSGEAWVAGFRVVGQEMEVRRRINMVSGGESSGYGLLTVEENLWMFSQFYGIPGPEAMSRIDRMLVELDLAEHRRVRVDSLSTGMRQKMNVIRGLVTEPEVLFLDEPTLGLDVNAARQIRAYLKGWMGAHPGRTILLTTHAMFEADELCDRIAIIDRGRILVCDTARGLKGRLGERVSMTVTVDRAPDPDGGPPAGIVNYSVSGAPGANAFEVTVVLEEESAISGLLSWLLAQGIEVKGLSKREMTLEDAFVALVGRGLEE